MRKPKPKIFVALQTACVGSGGVCRDYGYSKFRRGAEKRMCGGEERARCHCTLCVIRQNIGQFTPDAHSYTYTRTCVDFFSLVLISPAKYPCMVSLCLSPCSGGGGGFIDSFVIILSSQQWRGRWTAGFVSGAAVCFLSISLLWGRAAEC